MRRSMAVLAIIGSVAAGACGTEGKSVEVAATTTVASAGTTVESVASEDTSASTGAPYVGALTFDWPVGCDATVVENTVKGDNRAELTFKLETSDHPDGMLVSWADLKMLSFNGRKLTTAEERSLTAAFRLPPFVVDDLGSVVRIEDLDRFIDEMTELMPSTANLNTATFRSLMEETISSKYWNVWVGNWAETESIDQPVLEGVVDAPVGDYTLQTTVKLESLPTRRAGTAIFRSTEILEGPDFMKAIAGVQTDLVGKAAETSATDTGRRVVTVEVETDPTTLRPSRTKLRMEIDLTIGGESKSQLEERISTFTWSDSDC